MSRAKGSKLITEKEFGTIKKLQEVGVKTRMIRDITGRSSATVTLIGKYDTLRAYREAGQKYRELRKPQLEDTAQEAKQTPQGMVSQEWLQVLQGINDSLVNIDTRLKFIEEHTVVNPKSKLNLWR